MSLVGTWGVGRLCVACADACAGLAWDMRWSGASCTMFTSLRRNLSDVPAALRWYQFGAPWKRMEVDDAGALPCKP